MTAKCAWIRHRVFVASPSASQTAQTRSVPKTTRVRWQPARKTPTRTVSFGNARCVQTYGRGRLEEVLRGHDAQIRKVGQVVVEEL